MQACSMLMQLVYNSSPYSQPNVNTAPGACVAFLHAWSIACGMKTNALRSSASSQAHQATAAVGYLAIYLTNVVCVGLPVQCYRHGSHCTHLCTAGIDDLINKLEVTRAHSAGILRGTCCYVWCFRALLAAKQSEYSRQLSLAANEDCFVGMRGCRSRTCQLASCTSATCVTHLPTLDAVDWPCWHARIG